jgi:hypothetical protein
MQLRQRRGGRELPGESVLTTTRADEEHLHRLESNRAVGGFESC